MKVLLCTPYNPGPLCEQGGIVIWAKNIMDYYSTTACDVSVRVVPFNRRIRDNRKLYKRIWGGMADYWPAIKETSREVKNGYDVLHLCTSAQISLIKDYFVLKAAKRRGVKTVVHFHFGRMSELIEQKNWEWKLMRRVLNLANEIVLMDLKSFNALKELGFGNIHYLPNPLSLAIMNQVGQEADAIARKENRITFVGHVIPDKGVYELVEACKAIDGIELHIIGKCREEVAEKMRKIAGAGDWLCLDGQMEHRKVINELLSSGIFVLPSYTEGFPNVILESMVCSCAIVSTSVGAIPEMLAIRTPEPCGICCEPKDVEGLRDGIRFFIENSEEARKYSERAKKRVKEMYAVDKVWDKLTAIWRG